MCWSNGYQVPSGWEPGEIVKVPVPSHVNVDLDELTHENAGIYPCPITNESINLGGAKLNMRQHPVTPLFAVTPFKVQGQTTPRLIVDLRPKRVGSLMRNLSFEEVYVAISRVASTNHLRIITSDDGQLDHITRLRRPLHFLRWMQSYTPDGIYDPRMLKELGKDERDQALKTVQNWSRKDLRKQTRPILLALAVKIGVPVKKSGRSNQPLLADAWNAIFPIWRSGHPSRKSYKSRQETFHDQNLPNKTPFPSTPKRKPTSTLQTVTPKRIRSSRHPPLDNCRKTVVSRPQDQSKKNPDSQTRTKMESITSSHVIPRCSKKLRFGTLTPTTHGRRGQHRRRRPSVELRVFTPSEKQIIQKTRRTLQNLCRNRTNQRLRRRAWAKDVPEVGYMSILTVIPTVMFLHLTLTLIFLTVGN